LITGLVLHYVAAGPCYGNQLMERIVALTSGALAVNPNTMYPLLRSLEERGLIVGEWEHADRRSKRFYRITPAGEDECRRLAAAIAPDLEAISTTIELIRGELLAESHRTAVTDPRLD
jgi:PadR family transcriptional regulator